MNWRVKAHIQNVIARLPSPISYAAYYRLQRYFGALRHINPLNTVHAALEIANAIIRNGRSLSGCACLEVGTGRRLNLALTMWLLGAEHVITVDVNPYLRFELIVEDLNFMRTHRKKVAELFHHHDFEHNVQRLQNLLSFDMEAGGLNGLLEMCNISYLAPVDAADLPLTGDSVDFHVSTNVFEHIPRDALVAILREGTRVVKHDGLSVHRIDHSDHFSHSDKSISAINFLQYGDQEWQNLAGNRYMYMNRLRVDDFRAIFEQSGHEVWHIRSDVDEDIVGQLRSSAIPLDQKFAGKSESSLATLSSLFVTRAQASVSQPLLRAA